jgi:hypothetical protein
MATFTERSFIRVFGCRSIAANGCQRDQVLASRAGKPKSAAKILKGAENVLAVVSWREEGSIQIVDYRRGAVGEGADRDTRGRVCSRHGTIRRLRADQGKRSQHSNRGHVFGEEN